MYLRLLRAPYCRRQYGLYRPISLSLNTGFIALFRYRSIRALLFRPFAHLRRQRRHAGFGNVPEYAPSPRGLASLYLHQMGEKSLFESPYFAIAQYGLFIALFRYRSIRALGAAMCSCPAGHLRAYTALFCGAAGTPPCASFASKRPTTNCSPIQPTSSVRPSRASRLPRCRRL